MQINDETVHKRTITTSLSQDEVALLVAEAVAARAQVRLHPWYSRSVIFNRNDSGDIVADVSIVIDHTAPRDASPKEMAA